MKDQMKVTWKSRGSIDAGRILRKALTLSEAILWDAVRNRALDGKKFRRQHPIQGFVVDFCCIAERLIVEIDGPVHVRSVSSDREREEVLRAEGYRVLRLRNDEVEDNLQAALIKIRDEFRPSPPAPLPHAGEG
jgi:adenine-specific DNA-methyltransferase